MSKQGSEKVVRIDNNLLNMKSLFLSFILVATFTYVNAQQTVTTADGKKVVLFANNTWRYVDNSNSEISCQLPKDFIEPKSTKDMYRMLKPVGATIDDLRQYVAVDNEVTVGQIKIISFSEQPGNGIYILCVNGLKMKYRRTGSVFSKFTENIFAGEIE